MKFFVECSQDENDQIKYIRIFFTTKRILSDALKSPDHVTAERIYKLNWNNCPIFNDRNIRFEQIVSSLWSISNGRGEDYQFMRLDQINLSSRF